MIRMQTLNLSGFCGSKCDSLSYCSDLRCGGRIGVPTPSLLLPLVLRVRFLVYVGDELKGDSFSGLYLVNNISNLSNT